jgi:hypothetical protein
MRSANESSANRTTTPPIGTSDSLEGIDGSDAVWDYKSSVRRPGLAQSDYITDYVALSSLMHSSDMFAHTTPAA